MNLDDILKNNIYNNSINRLDSDEYLLNHENNRLTVYPIINEKIWEFYKIQQAAFWTAEEIDFSKDYSDFEKLNKNEQYFIKHILAFFSSSDTIVNINLCERFMQDIKIREVIINYGWQSMMENIHSEVYSLQIENIIRDPIEKDKLLNGIKEFPLLKEKTKWMIKWIQSNESFATRLIAFAIVEGVFFSGAFASIFWLKKRGIMPGLCNSNELIARDEGIHTQFAILLYNMIINKLSLEKIHNMFKEAVSIESEFIIDALPCSLIGMNANLMNQYIEYVADRLLVDLGYDKLFNSTNPFDFMESISIEGKTNFFEMRPTQYQKASVMNKTRDLSFNITNNF